MNKLKAAVLIVLVLLGTSAGVAKILKVPEELAFFQTVGLGESIVLLFGIVQLIGAILLVFRRTRLAGALVSAGTYLASAIMIFASGAIGFGTISLLPILMSGWITWDSAKGESCGDKDLTVS